MSKKSILLIMLLLLVGVNMQAQSISEDQMDERFNDNKLPYGWFTKGWKVDSTGVAKKGGSDFDMSELMGSGNPGEKDSTENKTPSIDISKLMGGGDSYNYLMTPPLSVQSGELLSFSAKKGKGGGSGIGSFMGGDSDSTFVVERAVYGEFKWIKVADFTTELDSVFKTFTVSNTNPGEYRFRFRAGGDVEIDSVAGFHIDMKAPDLFPIYQDKNVQPIDLSLCTQDTTMTFSVINTGTDTLNVSFSIDEGSAYTLDLSQASIAAADTVKVNLTFNFDQAQEGRNSTLLTFAASDERIEKIPLPIDAVKTQAGVYVQDFNTSEMPLGWFADGWEMKENTASVSKSAEDMGPLFSSNESFFLMTPPLSVKDEKEVLLFSVKKPGGGGGFDMSSMFGGGDEGSKLVVEKSVYGSNKWEKIKDFTNALDTVYSTQWISNIEPGDYRFRFVATDSVVIDSVAGYHFINNAPDMYVKLDSVDVRDLDFGLLTADTVKIYNVINTGTGDFYVNAFPSDPRYISLDKDSVSLKAGQSEAVYATIRNNEEAQGEVLAAIIFQPADQRIAMKTAGIHAYIIPKDSWQESFEPEYVVEDDTYPCRFPEGWISTGWEIGQSSGDMMSMFMGDDGGEKPYVASSTSNEYELITPRLQAKQGQVLKFNAQVGGGMAMMMAMFGADMGAPQYLSVYYKRDNDKDWTLYNMYFTSSDIFFKAPYSGFYQLKFVGGGSSVDEFIGFCVPKGSIELVDEQDNDNLLAEYNGKTVNVDYDRVLAAEDNDGSFTPKAYTVCLPYEFSINEYYEQGRVGLYQLDCIDQYYGQYVFQQVDDIIKPGQAYLAVVERDSIQFDAIDATITNENQQGVPVHDFGNWYQNGTLTELGMWQGVIKPIAVTEGETHNNIFMMDDEGNWNKLADDMTARAFRACFIANSDAFGESDKTSPDSAFARKATRDASWTFSTKFFKRNKDGQEEVVDIPNLLYKGDIRGGAGDTNGITPTIVTIDRDGTKNYYDLQGRRLSGKPDKGIYIVNGKKHMAR